MDYNKYFEEAKLAGIEEYELYISRNFKFEFELFRGEISGYTIADSATTSARGIVNGKMGYTFTEKVDETSPKYLAQQVKENAQFISSTDLPVIFKGSESYEKADVFDPSVGETDESVKINLLRSLEEKVKAYEYVTDVQLGYSEVVNETTLVNSHGLELSSKTNYVVLYVSVVAKKENEIKSGFEVHLDTNLNSVDLDKIAHDAVTSTVNQFGGAPCASNQYECVLDRDVASSLLSFFLHSISAEEVQKKSSVLADKLNQEVTSPVLTVKEAPLQRNCFFRYFDDEGVALKNKTLIENGVLKTYLYNLTTAAKDGVESTGNGFKAGATGSIQTSSINLQVEPGTKSLDELFQTVGNGIYITSVAGLHSGMNAQSGNFSLQANGYLIEDGKKGQPVNLITIAGNLFELFKNIKEVGSDVKLMTSSTSCPSFYIGPIAVSGK